MSTPSLGERIIAWAAAEPAVELCVLIGSRARIPGSTAAADDLSDWDFQVGTSEPELFTRGEWLRGLGCDPRAYALRPGRLGSARKASVVTPEGEIDLVVIPVQPLRGIARLVASGGQVTDPQVKQALVDLSAVVAGGYRLLKGADEFGRFYEWVAREIPPARLDDAAIHLLAESFVCDYVFTLRRLERGEITAAQRWLHHQLVETNLRLLHELRLRRGLPSFPDGRRLERLEDPAAADVRVSCRAEASDLRRAVEQAAAAHRRLVAALVGGAWRWPELPGLRLRAE